MGHCNFSMLQCLWRKWDIMLNLLVYCLPQTGQRKSVLWFSIAVPETESSTQCSRNHTLPQQTYYHSTDDRPSNRSRRYSHAMHLKHVASQVMFPRVKPVTDGTLQSAHIAVLMTKMKHHGKVSSILFATNWTDEVILPIFVPIAWKGISIMCTSNLVW